MKRREFLRGAAIVPMSVAAARWSAFAETLARGAKYSVISAVVYDERYLDCRLFAETLARQGARTFGSGGDAVSIWYTVLQPYLGRQGGLVAGLTTDSDRTASRACGAEMCWRLVYQGSHDCRVSDRLVHRLRGKGVEREVYRALLCDETPWPQAVADALARTPSSEAVTRAVRAFSAVTTSHSAGHPGYLASWLLAPSPLTHRPS
jgi:hypothetical protein